MLRSKLTLLMFALALGSFGSGVVAVAQEAVAADDVVRVRTRVVFLDALVRDKRTKNIADDLKQENFEALADGRPREISYFSREGDADRKPLAFVIVLDLRRDGAGRYLRRTDILEAMAAELRRLPARDEVAVLVISSGANGQKREWLARFTRDRNAVAAALAVVPTLVVEGAGGDAGEDANRETSVTSSAGDGAKQEAREKASEGAKDTGHPPSEAETKENGKRAADGAKPDDPTAESNVESVSKVVGKNGDVVTRTVYKDGHVKTTRTSKNGNVEVTLDGTEFDLAGGAHEAVKAITRERPYSRGAIVWLSDGITPAFYAERDAAVGELTKTGVIFSALVTDMKFGFKLLKPIVKPLGGLVGLSIYGTAQQVAKATGGEAVRVNRPADYASGLARIIGNLTGRYSLGFKIEESEPDDDVMHTLEVRVRARDAKGKQRKLEVTSRGGFFMPKASESAQEKAN